MRLKFHHLPPTEKTPTRATLLGREYKLEELRSITMATVDEDHSEINTWCWAKMYFYRKKTQKYHCFRHTKCTRFKHVQPIFNLQIQYLLWILAPIQSFPSTLMLAVAIAISIGFRSLYGYLDLARATPFTSGTRKHCQKHINLDSFIMKKNWTRLSWKRVGHGWLGSQANSLPDGLRSTTIHLDCSLQQNDKTEEFCRLSCFFSSKKNRAQIVGNDHHQWL